jgi:Uma2 family endonuclease
MEPKKRQRATYQDVLDAPEHVVAEIIGGELRLSPRPGGPATAVASSVGDELGPPFKRGRGGPGGWLIVDEPEIHIRDDIIVPDLAGWRRDRQARAPEGAFFTVAPDWVCEVLSRSTEKMDRLEKMPLYASWGVQYAWLIHPHRRTIETFCLRNGAWETSGVYGESDRARIEPFGAIEITVGDLWADAPLPTRASEERGHYEHGWW